MLGFELRSRPQLELTLQNTLTSLLGGIQIEVVGYTHLTGNCTLGHLVRFTDYDVPLDTYTYILTASHCTPDIAVVDTTAQVGQATLSLPVGKEAYDPPFLPDSPYIPCPSGHHCRYSDAAFYRVNDGVSLDFGKVAKTPLNSITIQTPAFQLAAGTTQALLGQTIYKTGRTTGRTQGTVTYTCVDRDTGFNNNTILCTWIGSYSSAGGDSGAPVYVANTNGTYTTVGIHWGALGSEHYFSARHLIEAELCYVISSCSSGFAIKYY
jgi:hypothetical protein